MDKNKTYSHPSGKQEQLANMENAPQVNGKNMNDTHNAVKEGMGPNTKR